MFQEIVFQLSQHEIGNNNSEFNYSLSSCQPLKDSFKRTVDTCDEKVKRFSRRKQRQSVQKFRSKSRSLRKSRQKMFQDRRQQQKIHKKGISNAQLKPDLIKKNFQNIYNIQHRSKQIAENKFKKVFETSKQNKQNRAKKINSLIISQKKEVNVLNHHNKYIQASQLKNYHPGKLLMDQNYLLKKILSKQT